MSTEPLLPSYSSATRRLPSSCPQHDNQQPVDAAGRAHFISAAPIIQTLSFLILAGTALISSFWACRSSTKPHPTPPASAPLLPYFASLSLIVSFACWIGYLVFISYDAAGGPPIQRKIVLCTSVGGKLVLAGAHIAIARFYKSSFPSSARPDWVLVFLAAQAWWDFLLRVVYSCLRSPRGGAYGAMS